MQPKHDLEYISVYIYKILPQVLSIYFQYYIVSLHRLIASEMLAEIIFSSSSIDCNNHSPISGDVMSQVWVEMDAEKFQPGPGSVLGL